MSTHPAVLKTVLWRTHLFDPNYCHPSLSKMRRPRPRSLCWTQHQRRVLHNINSERRVRLISLMSSLVLTVTVSLVPGDSWLMSYLVKNATTASTFMTVCRSHRSDCTRCSIGITSLRMTTMRCLGLLGSLCFSLDTALPDDACCPMSCVARWRVSPDVASTAWRLSSAILIRRAFFRGSFGFFFRVLHSATFRLRSFIKYSGPPCTLCFVHWLRGLSCIAVADIWPKLEKKVDFCYDITYSNDHNFF